MNEHQQQAVAAMESLCGVERVALAMAPRLTFPTDAELNDMARRADIELEARTEGRAWPRKPSPHDD